MTNDRSTLHQTYCEKWRQPTRAKMGMNLTPPYPTPPHPTELSNFITISKTFGYLKRCFFYEK